VTTPPTGSTTVSKQRDNSNVSQLRPPAGGLPRVALNGHQRAPTGPKVEGGPVLLLVPALLCPSCGYFVAVVNGPVELPEQRTCPDCT